MGKNKNKRDFEKIKKEDYFSNEKTKKEKLHPDIKKSVLVVIFLGLGVLLVLAGINQAGPWGATFYNLFFKLFGWGYYLLPTLLFLLSFSFLQPERKRLWGITLISSLIFVAAGLGFIDIIALGNGGLTGNFIGSLKKPFGDIAALVITFTALVASFLIIANQPIKISFKKKEENELGTKEDLKVNLPLEAPGSETKEIHKPIEKIRKGIRELTETGIENEILKVTAPRPIKNYTPPPLSLLSSLLEKPTIGDLQANANIIKRTLESFGINVEMGEINVGPTVTRYSLKPAEGMKLSKITALSQDLALALAAHPIRIEAPIPGKSLVGIEAPNKAAALVRLGNLFLYPEFSKSDPITFALGRNVSGEPILPSIDKMPHLLVAGSTGSGKSITIHCLIISLLYKNSPEMLKLLLIDPKRVELSVYDGLPHLIAPVVTDNKKAMGAFRWVINEMERRYEMLLGAGSRDIKSYNHKNPNEPLPYIVLIVDELADLMATYGREIESSIIRLAQMARATGIHLVVSTQRPSVEVITGLIKANITSRIALQVASQVDSRTILDTAGAEKLLGRGDLLYISAEKSKPQRIQGAYITEDEIKKVVNFIKKNNETVVETISIEPTNGGTNGNNDTKTFDDYAAGGDSDEELFERAVGIVRAAKKASASLLQRRLKVGYARAARLLDMMEEEGIVGPGDGAKPREVKI